jgi:chromosome segregation ATPase
LAKRGVIGSVEKINAHLSEVASERGDIESLLDAKKKYLEDYQKYLKFKQDANNLELLMQDQQAYLQYEDTGSSSANVDALQKRHDEFMAKLNAQDEKMKNLADQMSKITMAPGKHFAASEVDKIFKDLQAKRLKLKTAAQERKDKLNQSKEFFEFKIQCDDLNSWINDKKRLVANTLVVDPQNATSDIYYQIERNLTKHEAIEKELNANRTRLEKLKAGAPNLIKSQQAEMSHLVQSVESNWMELEAETKSKGKQLEEVKHKADLNASLSDVDSRFKNLQTALEATYSAGDLRSAKEALKKHNDLKKQMTIEADLINDMARDDSRNKLKPASPGASTNDAAQAELQNAVKEYMVKFSLLNPMLEEKQAELEANLNAQQLLFDVEEEMKWVEQSKKQIGSLTTRMPQTLFEAQNASKKLNELERLITMTHSPAVDKLLEENNKMAANKALSPSNCADLSLKSGKLDEEWAQLLNLCESKKLAVSNCLAEQLELDKINQVCYSYSLS